VQLSWTGSTDSGGSNLAGYKIYRQVGTGASLPVGTVAAGTTSFTDPHLQPSTGYTFKIVAFDNLQDRVAYTVRAVDNATNASAASTAANVTTDWELVFQDDFNRADTCIIGTGTSCGINSGSWSSTTWSIKDTHAYFYHNASGSGSFTATATAPSSVTGFRASQPRHHRP
jgi:fibronectin type III domain protein